MEKKIIALVVTYNRKELLKENINALLNQKYNNFDIIVVDNASTDGTEKMMKEYKSNKRIIYENTGANLGGAGGFHYGLKRAVELGYDFCWLMDDDTIPKENSLEILVEKAEKLQNNFSYLCSYVEWTDGKPCKMNQVIQHKFWFNDSADKLHKYGLMKLASCTFVSVFVNLEVTQKVGLPVRQMFIYGDDHEYTSRLGKEKPGYLVVDSVVVHKMGSNQGYNIEDIPKERISRYFYDSRNRFYRSRKEGVREILAYFYWLFTSFGKILIKSKNKRTYRIWVIFKGFGAGLLFYPKIEFVNRKEK